jgi:DNA-binding NarL/FixJ family response regulator
MTILIADDHTMFREGLYKLLNERLKQATILQSASGKETLDLLQSSQAGLVLLDIEMPDMNGIETAAAIKKQNKETHIIALTMFNRYDYVMTLYDAGVNGYVLKDCSFSELLKAIDMVAAGNQYFCEAVKNTLFKGLLNRNKQDAKTTASANSLTEREKEVLVLICKQHSTDDIAAKLFISPLTVNNHRRNILAKTGTHNVAGMVIYALQNGIYSLEKD